MQVNKAVCIRRGSDTMVATKSINITVDWVQVVRIVQKHKDKPQGVIALRVMEHENKLVNISRRR